MPYREHRAAEAITAITGREATAEELNVKPEVLEKWRSMIYHFVPIDEMRDRSHDDGGVTTISNVSLRSDDTPQDEVMIAEEDEARLTRALRSLSKVEYQVLIDENTKGMPRAVVEDIRAKAVERIRKQLT